MRIGFVSEYFPPFCVGGAELSSFQLARSLVRKGHIVDVLTPNYGGVSSETMEGVRIHRFWFPQHLKRGELARSRYLEQPLYPLYLAVQVFFWARRHRLEVLHAQNTHSLIGTLLAARLLRRRVVFSVRDFSMSDSPSLPPETARKLGGLRRWMVEKVQRLNDRWRRTTLLKGDAVVFVSHFLRSHYLEKGFQGNGRFLVIYNLPPEAPSTPAAIEEVRKRWKIPTGKKIVLYGGRRSLGKGMQTLLEAIPKVLHRYPNAHFVLAGRDTDRKFSEALSRLEGMTLLGPLPNRDFLDLMQVSDVVISPAIWKEPLSRLLLEALSFGKPVVATETGGTPEIILPGENGFLVPSGDAQSLSEKITVLLEDEALSQRMGHRGQALLQDRFSVSKLMDQWETVYGSERTAL